MTNEIEPPNDAVTAGRGDRGRRRGPFDYGELRLIALDMIAERPRHGYELIKLIAERMGGGYSPSPGVIYPTLTWLDETGYAKPEVEGGRKRYRATPEGVAYLAANRAALAEVAVHMGSPGCGGDPADPVLDAMEDIKRALRTRFARGPVDAATVAAIAATLRDAARTVNAMMTQDPDAGVKLRSVADVATPGAEDYLDQLCVHFARRATVRHAGIEGEVTFTIGTCHLRAEAGRLRMTAEADGPEGLGRVEDVVERHLVRFAGTEKLTIDWRRA